jgi:hypothetical protein
VSGFIGSLCAPLVRRTTRVLSCSSSSTAGARGYSPDLGVGIGLRAAGCGRNRRSACSRYAGSAGGAFEFGSYLTDDHRFRSHVRVG